MKEEREPRAPASTGGGTTDTAADDRSAQATSSETLSDVEKSQSTTRFKGDTTDSQKDAPSPDGAATQGSGGRADGSDSGGPM